MLFLKPVKKNDWFFCYMENEDENIIQDENLKKQAILTDKFIKLVDELKIDMEEFKTEKSLNSKVKELMKKFDKKIKKIDNTEE